MVSKATSSIETARALARQVSDTEMDQRLASIVASSLASKKVFLFIHNIGLQS